MVNSRLDDTCGECGSDMTWIGDPQDDWGGEAEWRCSNIECPCNPYYVG